MSTGIDDTSDGQCDAMVLLKGEGAQCDLAVDHSGWAHSNKVHELLWLTFEAKSDAAVAQLAEANKMIDAIETLLLYPDRVPTPLSNRLTVVLAEYRKKATS